MAISSREAISLQVDRTELCEIKEQKRILNFSADDIDESQQNV